MENFPYPRNYSKNFSFNSCNPTTLKVNLWSDMNKRMRCRGVASRSQYVRARKDRTQLSGFPHNWAPWLHSSPLEAEQEEEKAVLHCSFSSPASLRLRQRPLYIPLEKQWDREFSFQTQQRSVLRNPPDQLHLVNNERGSPTRILKDLLPSGIPEEAWEPVSFCKATIFLGWLIFHLSFASLACAWASGSATF